MSVAVWFTLPSLSASSRAAVLRQSFDGRPGQAHYEIASSGPYRPRASNDGLRLLEGQPSEANAVAFDCVARGDYRRIEATWRMRILPGADGAAFVLLDTSKYGEHGAVQWPMWEEPNLPGAFGVAFDIYDPPTQSPFDEDGNIENRPQREVSLHWNGTEVANRLSPVEFRGESWHDIAVTLDFVTGGAEVSVRVGQAYVYDRYFVPELLPFESRVALGARSGAITTTCDIKDLRVDYLQPTKPSTAPLTLQPIEHQLLDLKHQRQSSLADFPSDNRRYGRIVLTLTLSQPLAGFDPWDRKAAVYLYDEQGQRFEILRFITPYHRGYTWQADVTDYRPLLTNRKKLEVWCETYGQGWLATVRFDFYRGPGGPQAYMVQNFWVGEPEIGNPDKPVNAFFVPKIIGRDTAASTVKLRFVVTGHGMEPNSRNAGEFMPSKRTVTVAGSGPPATWDNTLWKTDNYLNPCRPQGGTWKYDRAGWGPGTIVPPWDIDITGAIAPGHNATVQYTEEPYLNEGRGKTWAPTHWVESQVIYYRAR